MDVHLWKLEFIPVDQSRRRNQKAEKSVRIRRNSSGKEMEEAAFRYVVKIRVLKGRAPVYITLGICFYTSKLIKNRR